MIEWNDSLLMFNVESKKLAMHHVVTRIKEVLDNEGTKLDSWGLLHDNGFTLPLSRSYTETRFGTGAIQIPSGESVVIMGNNLVYKYPLHPLDWCMLYGFVLEKMDLRQSTV